MVKSIAGREKLRSWLLSRHQDTIDADRLVVFEQELAEVSKRAKSRSAVVELGCYKGASAVWIRFLLDDYGRSDITVHVYDSFQGMPAPGEHDSNHLTKGQLATTPSQVRELHDRWGLVSPEIHAGWFSETLPGDLPPNIAFAYIDGDFYESTRRALETVIPRLDPGAVVLIDDYADTQVNKRAFDRLPGVKRACDEYFAPAQPIKVVFGRDDLAFGRYDQP